MKKLLFFIFITALTAINFSCKKNLIPTDIYVSDTIFLSDKSIDSIKKYISGNWKIYFTSSSWSSDSHSNYFVEFKFKNLYSDSIKINKNNTNYISDTFTFKKYRLYINTDVTKDTTNCIEFTPLNYPTNEIWYADYRYKDTLVLRQTYADGITFYCKKIN